jgi:hypothetical protein
MLQVCVGSYFSTNKYNYMITDIKLIPNTLITYDIKTEWSRVKNQDNDDATAGVVLVHVQLEITH